LTSATVTGGTTITISDNKGGATAKTLTTVDLTGIAGTATITGGAMNNLNVGAQTTTQVINIAGATTDHVLNLSVADTGITAAGVAAQVEVNDDTAKSVALTVNGTDNDILLDGDASMVGLTISGAGAAGIALDATTAVTSIDGSAATGNLDLTGVEAVAVTIKTGAGDDTFTTAATAALAADSGDGNDTVTLGAAVAAGSTVNLGGGNDDLISSSGSVATDTAVLITSVDGGAGSDMVAATLYTSGNSNQFTNFEVLGLDVTGSATFDTSLATGMTSLEMLATAAVYTNVGLSQSLAINANAGTGSNTLTFTATDVVGKNDSYEVDFGAKGAATSTAAAPTSIDGGTLVLAGVENVNITSGQASGFVSNVIDVTAVNMKTMTIDGASDTFTLAFAGATGTNTSATDAAVSMIDASGFTGETSIVLTNVVADNTATGLTVKGGEGIDDITTAQEATVYGNGGADTFTISDNATTVYGGAGNDIFEVALAVGSDDVVKIMDLAAGDTINFGTATAFGTTAVDVTAQTTLAGALGASDGTDNKVSYFDFGGTTYIILAGATTNAITDDTVIQLVGDVDLSGASLAANVLTIM
jgi:S-layer protein